MSVRIKVPPEAQLEGRYAYYSNSKPVEYFSSDDSSFEDPIVSSLHESNERDQKVGSRHKIQNKLKCSRCRCWKLEKEFMNVNDSRIMRTCNSCRRRNKAQTALPRVKKDQNEMVRQLPNNPIPLNTVSAAPSCFVPRQEGRLKPEEHHQFISRPYRALLQRSVPFQVQGTLGHYLNPSSVDAYHLTPLESQTFKRKTPMNPYIYPMPMSTQFESYPSLASPAMRYPFASIYPLNQQTVHPGLNAMMMEATSYPLVGCDTLGVKRDISQTANNTQFASKLDILAALSRQELDSMQEKRQECSTMNPSL